jgi:glutaredoxin 3
MKLNILLNFLKTGSKFSRGVMTESAKKFVQDQINAHKVVVFSTTYCPYCTKAKNVLKQYSISDIEILELDGHVEFDNIMAYLGSITGAQTVSQMH